MQNQPVSQLALDLAIAQFGLSTKFGLSKMLSESLSPNQKIQEAQLSPTDRATLRVTKYFAKSLKITQGH